MSGRYGPSPPQTSAVARLVREVADELLQTHVDIEGGVELQPVLDAAGGALVGPDNEAGGLDRLGFPGGAEGEDDLFATLELARGQDPAAALGNVSQDS